MGLFGKKDPCAICGGKVTGLFTKKIDGHPICKECYGHVHLPEGYVNNMSVEDFKTYMSFREKNKALKERFQKTLEVKMAFFGDRIQFDMGSGLFCMDANLEGTVFEGRHIKSFTIREDTSPLFEGSAAGLMCYTSVVPDRLAAMAPSIARARMIQELKRHSDNNSNDYTYDLPEPFERFMVEIHMEHPYWNTITTEKKGPEFNDSCPDVNDYLDLYYADAADMGHLARALMELAFPGAPEYNVPQGGTPVIVQNAAPDVAAELQKFKALMDQGIITEEEFTAKKRQLLGL